MVKRLPLSDAPPPSNTQWDTARCKRVIRPLLVKLKALREEVKRSEARTQRSRRTLSPDSGDNYEEGNKLSAGKRFRKPMRTYGALKMVRGKNTAQASGVGGSSVTGVLKGTKNIDYASFSCRHRTDDHLPLHWSAGVDFIAKGMVPASQDLSAGIIRPTAFSDEANSRIHRHQEAVYWALDQFLFATSSMDKGPPIPTLASMVSRQVAYCILAVGDDDMDWYDYVKGYGRSGEYLREVVRWHGIELLKDALAEGAMDPVDGGPGAIGTCIGLCRKHGAEREAEALLETLLFLNPVFKTSKTNPAFETIRSYFSIGPDGFVPPSSVYRILKAFTPLVYKNPSWMSSKEIQAILVMATKDIEIVPKADEMVIRLLESAFGLQGSYKTGEASPHEKIKIKSMPRIGRQKGEEVIAGVIRTLVDATLHWSESNARSVLIHLVKGYLSQDQTSKALAQNVWGEEWPGLVTSKIMAMAHVQRWSCGEASCTNRCLETGCFKELLRECRDEIALCLELLANALHGDNGFLLIAEYVRECYTPDTPSTTREEHEEELARVNSLTGRLLASISGASSSEYASMNVPETPKSSAPKVIIFTPGKLLTSEDKKWEKRRYLIGRLVLRIATQYQESVASFKHEWVKWATNIEKKVFGLKIKTPLETTVLKEDPRAQGASPKQKLRKGWRYEEGLGEWVSTGQTPGRKNRTPGRAGFEVVVSNRKEGDWRQEYLKFPSDRSAELDISDSEDGSDGVFPDNDNGELGSGSEEEQGSLYQGSDSGNTTRRILHPRSVDRTQAIRDSLRRFPMRSQLFIASTPAVDRSAELSSPIAKENLLSRFIDSGEILTGNPVEGSNEDEDEDSEDDEDSGVGKAVDEEDREEVSGGTTISVSSPIVSRLTRHNQSSFIVGRQESATIPPTSSPVQLTACASPSSPALSSRPPSSPPCRTKPTYGNDDMDIATDSDIDSDADYEPTITPTIPSTTCGTSNSLDDELSASDATFSRHHPSPPTPTLETAANASPTTPRPALSSNPPLSASSKRKIERSAKRRAVGRKCAMLRKRSIAVIARRGEDEMSADELA
ncbi:hypothetical protein C7212DRAFT_365820 [Tuber magnatum]|uniref:Uncharacterized protein n=1 Tax=Tuber magnatum TaxID=42249 RepID=A0A317SIG1_9PEZI|nr:hypothetical protein C7212DRAFT_365820 [Tuber magnatum]